MGRAECRRSKARAGTLPAIELRVQSNRRLDFLDCGDRRAAAAMPPKLGCAPRLRTHPISGAGLFRGFGHRGRAWRSGGANAPARLGMERFRSGRRNPQTAAPPLTIRRVPRRGQGPARAAECAPASPDSAQQSPAPTGAAICPGLFERPLNSTAPREFNGPEGPRERERQDEIGQARVLPNTQESARCLPTLRDRQDGAGRFSGTRKAPAAPEAARRAELPERQPTPRAASRRSCPRRPC